MTTATTTTLLQEAQATTKIAEGLTPDQRKEMWALLNAYCDFGSDISVSGFSEVLDREMNISDYNIALLVMDNSPLDMIEDNPDFDELSQDDKILYLAECDRAFYNICGHSNDEIEETIIKRLPIYKEVIEELNEDDDWRPIGVSQGPLTNF